MIFTFALIGCIVFIFSNSLQIADVSEGASGRVLGILQGILRHLGLPGAADRLTMHIVRKLAHFCEYLLEGFLLMLCLRCTPGTSSSMCPGPCWAACSQP